MSVCKKCGEKIPYRVVVNGKRISLSHRIYCINCSPLNSKVKRELGIAIDLKKEGKFCLECGKHYEYTKNNVCSTCRNRANRVKNKCSILNILGNKCCVCGYNKCSDAFDIHHVYEDRKVLDFALSYGHNITDLIKETEICVLLCAICHREFHAGLIDKQILIDDINNRNFVYPPLV